jgi:hypothetical protein
MKKRKGSTPGGVAVGRSTNHLTVSQFDLLRWVADGCKDGVHEGSSHRVSARALHNRGFLRVSGSGTVDRKVIWTGGAAIASPPKPGSRIRQLQRTIPPYRG